MSVNEWWLAEKKKSFLKKDLLYFLTLLDLVTADTISLVHKFSLLVLAKLDKMLASDASANHGHVQNCTCHAFHNNVSTVRAITKGYFSMRHRGIFPPC